MCVWRHKINRQIVELSKPASQPQVVFLLVLGKQCLKNMACSPRSKGPCPFCASASKDLLACLKREEVGSHQADVSSSTVPHGVISGNASAFCVPKTTRARKKQIMLLVWLFVLTAWFMSLTAVIRDERKHSRRKICTLQQSPVPGLLHMLL